MGREQQKADRESGRDSHSGRQTSDSGNTKSDRSNTTPVGDFSRFGGYQNTDSDLGFGGIGEGGGGGLGYDQAMMGGAPQSVPSSMIDQYRDYVKNFDIEYDQAQRVQNVGTTTTPYQGPEAPYDYKSLPGLAKFGFDMFGKPLMGGGMGSPLQAFGKSLKFNYDRTKALEKKVMNDFGISAPEAQKFMEQNGLTINQIYNDPNQSVTHGPSGEDRGLSGIAGSPGMEGMTMGQMEEMFGAGASGGFQGSPAEEQAFWKQDATNFLMEQDASRSAIRTGATEAMAGGLGLPGGTGTQQDFIDQTIASPLYKSIMGGREAGEEAILRSAGATGGLRSGNVNEALYDYNAQLERKALLDSYNQRMSRLGTLTGLGSYAPQIAEGMSSTGETLAAGRTAAQQREEAEKQQMIDNIMGGLKLGTDVYQSGALQGIGEMISNTGWFSDRRLKKNIKKIGESNGLNLYRWDWNIVANKMGMVGESFGCMADEVYRKFPEAVIMRDMFMFVLYPKIGITHG